MPKPLAGAPGSGLHFHLSLTDAQGRAVMAAPAMAGSTAQPGGQGSGVSGAGEAGADASAAATAAALGLSADGLRFAAGLLAPRRCARCFVCAHGQQLQAAGRQPQRQRHHLVARLENPGRQQPYLPGAQRGRAAGVAHARPQLQHLRRAGRHAGRRLDGMDHPERPQPAACDEDLYQRLAAGLPMPPALPRDLHAALDALEANAALREAVGDAFCQQFLTLKRDEWTAYAQHVSAWELARYADAF